LQQNFETALAHVLKYEGGYSDHPSDPGGATNRGITKAVLEAYRGHSVSKADVRALSRGEAAAIYRSRYWDAAKCDRLPDGLDLAVFDCAVNQGIGRASRFLQQAAQVTADGKIGPKTLAAVAASPPEALLVEFHGPPHEQLRPLAEAVQGVRPWMVAAADGHPHDGARAFRRARRACFFHSPHRMR